LTLMKLQLPNHNGSLSEFTLTGIPVASEPLVNPELRKIFAAAHVVPDPFANCNPSEEPVLDWEATLAYRRHLATLGLGIAEAMDTSQRGNGLSWSVACELIKQTLLELPDAEVYCGAGTDHLLINTASTVADVIQAYLYQIDTIQEMGGRIIVMASRALARAANNPKDYIQAYREVLNHCENPVIIHWLGDMFDPQLAGYWGSTDWQGNLETVLAIIRLCSNKIDGVKLSVLDKEKEIEMRRLLPETVRMYTGDDFNYPELILGDAHGHSDALLGIFDPLATICTQAMNALDNGDIAKYNSLFAPTVPLARHVFSHPTQYYKTGVVFLAWLNGFQDHFIMVNGAQSMRSLPYFVDCFKLADRSHLFNDPERAIYRMKSLLRMYGV